MRFAPIAFFCIGFVCLQTSGFAEESQSVDVLTYHYDNWRTGWNSKEKALTPSSVKGGYFGLLYKINYFDEQIDAQPLILSNFLVGGKRKNVVLIVTEYNSLYALDAENGALIATRSLGTPVPSNVGASVPSGIGKSVPSSVVCGNSSDHLGINSTPVVNEARDTLYLIAAVWSGAAFDYVLHAIDLSKMGDSHDQLPDKVTPKKIVASATLMDGTIYPFQANFARQRSALLLSHDRVYAGFSTFCDWNPDVSRGWLLGWDANTLNPLPQDLTDHRPASKVGSGRLGAIWMSGYGPSADEDGNVFVVTGNSHLPSKKETLPPTNIGIDTYLPDSVVKFNAGLIPLDWFTPSDKVYGQKIMDISDNDFGSGGVLLVPEDDATRSFPAKTAVAAGKLGQLYLMNRDSLGKFDASGVNHVLDVQDIGSCFCGPSYFEGADGVPRIVSSGNAGLKAWRVTATGNSIALAPDFTASQHLDTDKFQKGFFTSVSSNERAADSAVIWAIPRPQKGQSPQTLVLHAFNAKDGEHLCAADAGTWPMNEGPGHSAAPNVVPVVAGGKVFVASYKELRVFGAGGTSACAAVVAEADKSLLVEHIQTDAPSSLVGQFMIVQGTIVDVTDAKLHLKSGNKVFEVDLLKVMENGHHGNIDPGKPVTIRGTSAADGSLKAESIFSGD